MSNQPHDLIQPAPVERDAYGAWWHPDLPDLEEGDAVAIWEAWIDRQQLQVEARMMFEDGSDELSDRYHREDDGFAFWHPPVPEGDGWFLLCLADTEEGPVAWWGRRAGE